MIAFVTYAIAFSALIFYNGFFGFFKDDKISKKQFSILFLLKTLAVPAFYIIYKKLYGGIENLDAGIFYHDAKALNEIAYTNFSEFFKTFFGSQNENEDFHVAQQTHYWDNGREKDFFYNDNRIVIRIHALLHFIAFNSYFVHALFSCFLSFVGIFFLYKSIKQFFEDKEIFVLLILCFFPALWFHTGALLKEGVALFVLGCTAFQLKQMIYGKHNLITFLWLAFLLWMSLLLKPYVLFCSAFCFALFFFIYKSKKIKHKSSFFFLCFAGLVLLSSFLSSIVNHKSLFDVALQRQRNFISVAKGGIFLENNEKFVRLKYDTTLVNCVNENPNLRTIKKDVPYFYWKNSHPQDSLFCAANQDTLTQFTLVNQWAASNSNIDLSNYTKNNATMIFASLYYSLLYPFFFNAKNILQVLASFENLAILVSLLACFISFTRNKKENFPGFVFLLLALSVCFLIGLTTPNSGAIFRYRSLAVVFILLAGLYYLPRKIKRR